jgi:hypothetical protein
MQARIKVFGRQWEYSLLSSTARRAVDPQRISPVLKQLPICAALMAFAAGTANAQQKEAVLRRLDAPGAAFDIILAIPKPQGAIFEFSESPDALVVHLIGGELALGFEDAETMLKAARTLRRPLAALKIESPGHGLPIPVAVYLVGAGE